MSDTQAPLDFQTLQYRFAAKVRDPDNTPDVPGVDPARVAIYQELVFNNTDNMLEGAFPVLRSLLDDSTWRQLIEDFIKKHIAHKPLFRQMSEEFLDYLQNICELLTHWPFVVELAHYEWVELVLYLSETCLPINNNAAGVDLWQQTLTLSPLCHILSYQYPVHQIGADFIPDKLPEQPTFLCVYRNREDSVEFMVLNAVAARALSILDDASCCAELLMQQLAGELNQPLSNVKTQGQVLLRQLCELDIILAVETDTKER